MSPLKTGSETSTEETLGQSQNYLVTLVSNWNKKDHLELPGSAHFSKPAVVHHKSDYTLIPFGGQATPGLEELRNWAKQEKSKRNLNKKCGQVPLLVTVFFRQCIYRTEHQCNSSFLLLSQLPIFLWLP